MANRRYEPFGSLLSAGGTGESVYGFASEQVDASTGLVYLRARYLDTDLGRFTQVDPSGWEANPYLYAGANPANYTDAAGTWAWRTSSGSWQHDWAERWYMGTDPFSEQIKQLEYPIPVTGHRPDMFNSLLGGVYEIEPVYMAAAPGHGLAQTWMYIAELSFLKPFLVGLAPDGSNYNWTGTFFHPGLGIGDWPGQLRRQWRDLPPGYQYVADFAVPGLVPYWLEPPPEVVLAEALAAIAAKYGAQYAKLLRERGWSPRPSPAPQPAFIDYVVIGCGVIIIVAAGVLTVVAIADDGTFIGVLDDALLAPLLAKLAELGLTLLRTPSGALRLAPMAP